jgi:hypothetical protein
MRTVKYNDIPTPRMWRRDCGRAMWLDSADPFLARLEALLEEYARDIAGEGLPALVEMYRLLEAGWRRHRTVPAVRALRACVGWRLGRILSCEASRLRYEIEMMFGVDGDTKRGGAPLHPCLERARRATSGV